MRRASLSLLCLVSIVFPAVACASTHAGAPKPSGAAPKPTTFPVSTWTSGNKDGFGTAYTYDAAGSPKPSRVWFTLSDGSLSEMYYPTLDTAAINRLLFVVSDGKHFTADETQGFQTTVSFLQPQSLAYRVVSVNKTRKITLTKEIVTDPTRDVLVIQMQMVAPRGTHLYVHLEPALENSSLGNRIAITNGAIEAWAGSSALALASTGKWGAQTVAYRNVNDGVAQLRSRHTLRTHYASAGSGRVDATVELSSHSLTLALGYDPNRGKALSAARTSLKQGFAAISAAYIAGWQRYLTSLPRLGAATDSTFDQATMTIKAAEDKTYPGAIVASPTHPFGQVTVDDPSNHGYVKVWPRDLYHSAMGLLAAGDSKTANEALEFLAHLQYSNGNFPQNAHVQELAADTGTQLDEVADPILLAWRLGRQDLYQSMVKRAADFIVANGPSTPQERWEESGGYSPSTIASEIAALVAASDMAGKAGDTTNQAKYLSTANSWSSRVEDWTFTTTGPLGQHRYYLRLTQGDPNSSQQLSLANNGGIYDQREIVDGGFLELVRLGVRDSHDEHVLLSLPVIDAQLETVTPKGPAWHRYNHDGYDNADNHGHPWPVLAGERGMYDLIAGDTAGAQSILTTLQQFAGPTGLVPEQVYEKTAEPTTSARPLIWAEGEYLVLDRSLHDGAPFDRPSVVAQHFASH